MAVLGLKPEILANRDKPAYCLQTQLLWVVHADVHYSAWPPPQAPLVLEASSL
jgi:hypothetical protein